MDGSTDDIRVLHVDDDEDILSVTAEHLEREGLSVVSEMSASTALDRLDEEPIDCVVSDYEMPATNGLELLRAVRERDPNLPFILFTGRGSEEVASEAISAGVTDYLQKAGPDGYVLLANRVGNAVERTRSRREVERTRERFARLFEGSSDVIFVFDEDGTVTYASQPVERVLGYEPDELVGTDGFDLVHADDADGTRAQFETLVAEEHEPVFHEFRARHADGSWRVLEVRGRNLLDDDVVAGIVVNARDVTHRRKREETLADLHEAREDLVTAGSAEAIADIAVETARDVLGQSLCGVHLHRDGQLVPVAVTEAVERTLEAVPVYDGRDRVLWEVFRGGEPRVFDDVDAADVGRRRDTPIRSAVLLPLGEHGVFIVSSTEGAAFGELDVDFATLLADATRTALTRRERERALEELHDVATDLEGCETAEAVAERIVTAAENVLEFDLCSIAIEKDGTLPPTATSSNIEDEEVATLSVDEGLMGKTYRTRESFLLEDVSTDPSTEPQGSFEAARSGISVPVGDHGVFQAVAETGGGFDEWDLELSELLATHAGEALTRIESAADLREEHDRLAALFESVPEPVVHTRAVDGEPVVENVNSAFERVFGYGVDAIVGAPLDDHIVPPDRTSEAGAINERVAAGESIEREVRRLADDGERDFLFRLVPLPGIDPGEYIGVYVDITEQKRHIEELRRQNERLESFASIVSHDLRNPLNLATGRLELAREERDDPNLEEVSAALDRMNELVDAVLELARQGRTVADPGSVELADVVASAWATAGDDHAAIKVRDDLPTVEGDRERLRALFENLFRNSVEHGSTIPGSQAVQESDEADGVRVVVGPLDVEGGSGEADGHPTGFYVADDGPGIPSDERDRVFEHGYSTDDDGTGFGLAIVREIARAHGWTIDVGERSDSGAQFRFTVT